MRVLSICIVVSGFFNTSWAQIHFRDVAEERGISVSYGDCTLGGGISFYDFDQDGWDDITIATSYGKKIKFYKNLKNGHFELMDPSFLSETYESKHILWLDYDNDGDKDLYVSYFDHSNLLYQNDGSFNFTNVTEQVGLPLENLTSLGVAWADYDRDGWLDLYITDKRYDATQEQASNRMFKSTRNGQFVETTLAAGVADSLKLPFCASFFDYNQDGWQDLYIVQDLSPTSTLFHNNGDGTFKDVSVRTNTYLPNVSGMGIALGDCNGNGFEDIYVTNIEHGNKLLLNNGDGTFEEVADHRGVGFYGVGWGTNFVDYDNDQDLDLYVSGALVGTDVTSSAVYENTGNASFTTPNIGFKGDTIASYSNALGDIDNDGYLDIAVNNIYDYPSQLWKNSGGSQNWIKIDLEGVISNRDAIGSMIEVYLDGHKYIKSTQCGISFLGQNSSYEHFGLGSYEQVDSIIVRWPSGHVDKLLDITANQRVSILEGSTNQYDPVIQIEGPEVICPNQKMKLSSGLYSSKLNYRWSNGSTNPYILIDEPGYYELSITGNSINYTGSINATIEYSGLPQFDVEVTHLMCHNDGSGKINVTGDELSYIEWSDDSNDTFLKNLQSGKYTALIVNTAGCESTIEVDISEPDPLELDLNFMVLDQNSNQVSVAVTGGTAPYQYLWNDQLKQTTELVKNLPPGIYTVVVTDNNGCEEEGKIKVESVVTALTDKKIDVLIYPNPWNGNGSLIVESKEIQIKKYALFGNDGKELFSTKGVNEKRIEIQPRYISKGMIHMVIENSAGETSNYTIIKN